MLLHKQPMASLPESWQEEHDHFIIYMHNSPTVHIQYTSLNHIWQNLQDIFPYLGSVDYEAFCTREEQLQDSAMQMLMDVWNMKYWWAHNHPWNPFMDSKVLYSENLLHAAAAPLEVSLNGIFNETTKQKREALWDTEHSAAEVAKVAEVACLFESHTKSPTAGKTTTVRDREQGHQEDNSDLRLRDEDDADRTLRKVLEEELDTMKARRRQGFLKRE